MRISRRARLVTLSLVAGVFASAQPAVGNECIWVQWQDPLNGRYVGLWDCGYCVATYVWWPGDPGWTPDGGDCPPLPT
jgi:hypothetical protein